MTSDLTTKGNNMTSYRRNLPICATCGRTGTFPPNTDGSDMAEYSRYHTSHGYAYCEVCSGADCTVTAPDGESVQTFPVPERPASA